MANDNRSGHARSISMSDFNARAKRIAEQTAAIEKPEKAPSNRSRRTPFKPGPQTAETETETQPAAEESEPEA
ncbi:hypothetical protein [Methylobacterium soli]|jgi:hypothetical protein|uniref:Uncharacterized protein n=1 Tax=Methylobacterium soli TaxID=553447 RepID=A0A6L3T237_9HYPH|nr:hypothetical protein [Methylobacterium soli]KAB1080726.1 hypothetical protein F6X53_06030 [Methylobacterium soli]